MDVTTISMTNYQLADMFTQVLADLKLVDFNLQVAIYFLTQLVVDFQLVVMYWFG